MLITLFWVLKIISKYERVLIPLLLAVAVVLISALVFIWWEVLRVKPVSQPGDFLKIEKHR